MFALTAVLFDSWVCVSASSYYLACCLQQVEQALAKDIKQQRQGPLPRDLPDQQLFFVDQVPALCYATCDGLVQLQLYSGLRAQTYLVRNV